MNLREQIAPQMDIAEKQYPEIHALIMEYAEFCDAHGDEDNSEYKKLEQTLHQITGKDMSRYNLWEWWEEEGAEVLAFRIALPDPKVVEDVTKEELKAVIECIESSPDFDKSWDEMSFSEQFSLYLDDYYYSFLKLNFTTYDYKKIFGPQKDKSKKQFWWTTDEKVGMLWSKRQ